MADTFTLGRNQLKRLLSSDFEEVSSEEDNKPCYNAVPPPVSLPGEKVESVQKSQEDDFDEPMPPGANPEQWARLQNIRRKREAMQKKFSKHRKNLQKQIVKQVVAQVSEKDLEDMGLPELAAVKKPKPAEKKPSAGEQLLQERDKLLAEVKPYLGANQRFEPPCAAEYAKKSELEVQIDAAIAKGDYVLAQKLSTELSKAVAARELLMALNAKRYAEQQQKEAERQRAHKRPALHWTFDSKARWEQKGNM